MTLNDRIRKYCTARGLTFKPWEATPWDVDDGPCNATGTAFAESWPKAQRLRKKIIKALTEAKQ